jgi:hypothetical protein
MKNTVIHSYLKRKYLRKKSLILGVQCFCNNLADGLFVMQHKSRKVKQKQHEAYTEVRGAHTILI